MRKDVGRDFRTMRTATHLHRCFIRFAAHQSGIDGLEERGHGVVLGHEEEIDGAIRAGDVAVKADSKAEYDFAHGDGL